MNIAGKCTCFLLCGLIFAIGCGSEKRPPGMPKVYPCKISITQEGKPVEGVSVELYRKGDPSFKWPVSGRTDASGNAVIMTYGKYHGAPEGDYLVTVDKRSEEGTWPSDDNPGTMISRFILVDPALSKQETTSLEMSMPKKSFTHTIEIGKAQKILLEKINPGKSTD